MSDFSIAEAKSQFAQLVHQAEAGAAVRITRRGRPVAVLLSESEFARLSAPHQNLMAFTRSWRKDVVAAGLPLFGAEELGTARDRSEREPLDLR